MTQCGDQLRAIHMGKRTAHLTGLSRYALDALKETQTDAQCHQNEPPSKRRRTDGEGPKYYAYNLATRYDEASQVPEHLKKCMPKCQFHSTGLIYYVSC